MKSLRSAFATLSDHQIKVTGVSMDTIAAQKTFSDKFAIPFPLLCDTTGVVCDTFGVKHPENIPARETFLFRNGKLVHHDNAVNPANQANDALRKIEELSAQLPR